MKMEKFRVQDRGFPKVDNIPNSFYDIINNVWSRKNFSKLPNMKNKF